MEMPKITPGMTSGASIRMDNACLPQNLPRSREKGIAGADERGQQRDPSRDDAAGPQALEQIAVREQAHAPLGGIPQEPVEREAMPRRRRVGCIVEGEHRHHDQRQKQKNQKPGHVQGRRKAQPARTGQGGNHVRRITSPKRWPASLKPSITSAVDSPSNRKPKAAPCSQLKRVMNCA